MPGFTGGKNTYVYRLATVILAAVLVLFMLVPRDAARLPDPLADSDTVYSLQMSLPATGAENIENHLYKLLSVRHLAERIAAATLFICLAVVPETLYILHFHRFADTYEPAAHILTDYIHAADGQK